MLLIAIIVIIGITISWSVINMTQALDKLTAKVTLMVNTADAAVVALKGVADEIRTAITADEAKTDGQLGVLADSLDAKSGQLAEAIAFVNGQTGGQAGNDTLVGGQGNDSTTSASVTNDTLSGTAGNDVINEAQGGAATPVQEPTA